MSGRSTIEKARIRTRRVAIYTFLIILILLYISAHQKLEKERVDRTNAAAEAGGHPETLSGDLQEPAVIQGGGENASLTIRAEDMWSLILTNAKYPVPENYRVELTQIPHTEQSVDARIYEQLIGMLQDMEEAGLSPVICSGYRTLDKQEKLFNRKVQSYVKKGYAWESAYTMARQTLSIPGSGEHCLGLAVDFLTEDYHQLDRGFEETPESIWLREYAQEYGFIMRYEEGKEAITGITYEPWHYRYVGVEAARYIKAHNLTLEEFYVEQSLYG